MKPAPFCALLLAAGLGLSACESDPAIYAPTARSTSAGYMEYRIDPGRYSVTFRGDAGASRDQVEALALKRAADLTLRDGYDWFQVIEGYGDASERGSNDVKITTGSDPAHKGPAFGVATSNDPHGGVIYTQTIEVQMGKGARPDDSRAYDAHTLKNGVSKAG